MKIKTNIKRVTEFMLTSPIHLIFLIEAVSRYAKLINENTESVKKEMEKSFVNPESWIAAAKTWENINK